MVRHGALHGLADPPGRIRGELEAAAPVELLDRAIEAERSLLDQVEERHSQPAISLGDRDDEPQVRLDHAALGDRITALDALRERDLVGSGQELVAAHVCEEELQRIGRARQRLGGPDGRFCLFLLPLGVGQLLLGVGVGLRLSHLETDGLELTRDLLGFLVVQLVLEHKRLELDRFHPAALLRALDQTLDLIGFEQFCQLVLRQEVCQSFRRTPVCTISIDSMQVCPVFPGREPRYSCHKLTTRPLRPLFHRPGERERHPPTLERVRRPDT